ncbi:MAG: MBL fold metallo-hydrolase [Pseudomonadota bacterium]
MELQVTFWGTRGSIPRPMVAAEYQKRLRAILNAAKPSDVGTPQAVNAFIEQGCRGALPTIYGGNTACVQVHENDGPSLLIDFGSGAREYASRVMQTQGPVSPEPFHVLMSHFHWDHIMGFPFFMPAYIPGNVIHIYSCHDNVEEAFRRQHGAPSFPVPFDVLGSEIHFHIIQPGQMHEINGFEVTPHELNHAGRAYGFRVERGGHSVVYASDAEHKPEMITQDYPYVDWVRQSDILIFDAQYSLAEATSVKEDWGHSSNVVGVELALMGDVKHLVFFHHEPLNDDIRLDQIVQEARRIEEIMRGSHGALRVSGAYDGLQLTLE